MLVLSDFLRLLPLFVVFCVVPKFISVVVRVRDLECGEHDRVLDAGCVARAVIEYPLKEELLFRGLPYLLAGNEGLLMGTVMWYLGHILFRLNNCATLAEVLALVVRYGTATYFYTYAWINAHTLVPIIYHVLSNALGIVLVESIVRRYCT